MTEPARLYLGDCRQVMRELPEASVHAVVTDPPYGLGTVGRSDDDHDWDKLGDGRGLQAWHELWAREALRVLVPGGVLLAFAHTRTYHRLACALEDEGFEIRDMVAWLHGQGTPKSKDRHLKPALEPVAFARKPGGSLPLNIDVCRIASGPSPSIRLRAGGVDHLGRPSLFRRPGEKGREESYRRERPGEQRGRFPANVVLSHSIECQASGWRHTDKLCIPECPVRMLNEQAPDVGGGMNAPFSQGANDRALWGGRAHDRLVGIGDGAGGAARFFYIAKTRAREKVAGLAGENRHPTVKSVDLMRWLIRLVTPEGGVVLDPFLGSGSTGCAAAAEAVHFIGIEEDAGWLEVARERCSAWAFAHGLPNAEVAA